MAENSPLPPTSATTTSSNGMVSAGETRGLPYYEKLRRDLRETISRKRQLDKSLAMLEDKIYRYENKYLEETQSAGNIVRGFDNYIKGTGTTSSVISGGAGTSSRRRANIIDQDRIFSGSSVGAASDSPGPGSVSSTPHATTPSGGIGGNATGSNTANTPTSAATPTGFRDKNHKKRKGGDDDADDTGKNSKRVRVTFGGIGS